MAAKASGPCSCTDCLVPSLSMVDLARAWGRIDQRSLGGCDGDAEARPVAPSAPDCQTGNSPWSAACDGRASGLSTKPGPGSRPRRTRQDVLDTCAAPWRCSDAGAEARHVRGQHHLLEPAQRARRAAARPRTRRAPPRPGASPPAPRPAPASSTKPPRAVLIRMAEGFIRASRGASIRWRVSAVSGACRETKSDRAAARRARPGDSRAGPPCRPRPPGRRPGPPC